LHTSAVGPRSQNGTSRYKTPVFNGIGDSPNGTVLAGRLPFSTGQTALQKTAELPLRGQRTGRLIPMETSLNLKGPASESQKGVVLIVCLLVMSAMCIGLIWQAQIISEQRENIKWLETLKFGG
jgi:hypothetical protein